VTRGKPTTEEDAVHIFNRNADWSRARTTFATRDWAVVPNGVDPAFLAELVASAQERLSADRLAERAIKGKKEQALYTPPDEVDIDAELRIIETVTGMAGPLTLSERHLQGYDEHADPDPPAHKDRSASAVSVGISVLCPEGTRLVFWPTNFNEPNEEERAVYLAGLPENSMVGIRDQPGDVIMFRGRSTWHARRNAAGAVNLYLKVNPWGADPLGEHITTAARA